MYIVANTSPLSGYSSHTDYRAKNDSQTTLESRLPRGNLFNDFNRENEKRAVSLVSLEELIFIIIIFLYAKSSRQNIDLYQLIIKLSDKRLTLRDSLVGIITGV